jgi:hypothetical protein
MVGADFVTEIFAVSQGKIAKISAYWIPAETVAVRVVSESCPLARSTPVQFTTSIPQASSVHLDVSDTELIVGSPPWQDTN